MVRVTLTLELPDDEELWGANDAYDAGGETAVEALMWEDIQAFAQQAVWKIEHTNYETEK